jgi:hypothetical protein
MPDLLFGTPRKIRVEKLCIATLNRDLRENDVAGMADWRFVLWSHSARTTRAAS